MALAAELLHLKNIMNLPFSSTLAKVPVSVIDVLLTSPVNISQREQITFQERYHGKQKRKIPST